jgi:hypothetical protein
MWVLVYITLEAGLVFSTIVDLPGTMDECFRMRDMLSEQVGKGGGYFNLSTQAICVQINETDL